MIRTQISLSQDEYKSAKREAEKRGLSLAELLRRSLRSIIPVSKEKPWMKYAGMVDSQNPNSSQEIDDIIYGQKD
ncbi:ribbon-helix-helix domain-containing protein [bacterium]|nr:ribbon-helix-helix domain-containing protein [bacterium]